MIIDTINLDGGLPFNPETGAEQQNRLAREADGIARARASIAAGYRATSVEVNAWIDSLGTDNPLPLPYPRHPRPRRFRTAFRVPREPIYAPEALMDIDTVSRWLTQPGSGPRAWRRPAAIRDGIECLREQPCLWPRGQHPGTRELPGEGGYRTIYEGHPDTGHSDTAGGVFVLRVYGPGQDRSTL